MRITAFLLTCLVAHYPLTSDAATIEGYVGHSSTQVAPGVSVKLINAANNQLVDIDNTGFFGNYEFTKVAPGHYLLQVGEFKRELMIKSDADEERIDIDLSAKSGIMDYSRAGSSPTPLGGAGNTASSGQPSANNAGLQQQIAGLWWGYAGSTERKIGLCPDGSYQDYTESGYSGGMYDSGGYQTGAWGSASQSGGQGRWTIQGDSNNGVISVQYNNGQSTSLRYNQIGDPGCLNINGNTLCRQSASCR